MSRDPYMDSKADVEANISNVVSLLASYDRIQSTSPGSSTLAETLEELQTTVGLLEVDLQDLEDCVRVVEDSGDRWGIGPAEVRNRRAFLNDMTQEVKRLAAKVQQRTGPQRSQPTRYRDDFDVEAQAGGDTEEIERWEREEQQMLMRRQDDTLGVISGTLNNLQSQAGMIGQEVTVHSEMLDDLGSRVDTTQSRLGRVAHTLQDFARRNENSRSSWCIGILIVILIILLVMVILV